MILDRLERAHFVKRVRSSEDRRKVFVKVLPGAGGKLSPFYESIGREMQQLASRYTVAELQLIEGYLEANLEILQRKIEELSPSGVGRAGRAARPHS